MKRTALAAWVVAACTACSTSLAADRIKIGFLSTLSGPNAAIGVDIRDGFQLAVKMNGGKLGGLPADVLVDDDQLKPDLARQIADRFVRLEKVHILTGIVFSNTVLAAAPVALENKTVYIAPNAAPSQFAGKGCSPYFFVASWPNDAYHEAAGQHATAKGYKNMYLIAPNYQGGKDSLNGFKRFYKGNIAGEVYTQLGQLDYGAELAQLRVTKPDAAYVFLPGGMGINFVKQFVGGGISKDMALIVPGFGDDQDILRGVGDPMLGLFDTAHWAMDLDNPANRKFVAAFEAEFKRLPTVYASQGYDTAMLIDAAARDAKGKVEDSEVLRKAIKAAHFDSVRGGFRFNRNNFPIQNYYLRVVAKDAQGRLINKTIGTVLKDRGDAYVDECAMK